MTELDPFDLEVRLAALSAAPLTREQVNRRLEALAGQLGIDGLVLDEDGIAVLSIDDVDLTLNWVPGAPALTATTPVGDAGGCPADFLRVLLRANGDWGATLGGVVGIDPSGRHILLGRSLLLNADGVMATDRDLASLVDQARAWRLQLAVHVDGDFEPRASTGVPSLGMLRV